jgi:hypothetical protein
VCVCERERARERFGEKEDMSVRKKDGQRRGRVRGE